MRRTTTTPVPGAIRDDLLVCGHDPATVAGQVAFLELSTGDKARYLKRIEYMASDVANLLDLLMDDERAEVLAYRDGCASELSWP